MILFQNFQFPHRAQILEKAKIKMNFSLKNIQFLKKNRKLKRVKIKKRSLLLCEFPKKY